MGQRSAKNLCLVLIITHSSFTSQKISPLIIFCQNKHDGWGGNTLPAELQLSKWGCYNLGKNHSLIPVHHHKYTHPLIQINCQKILKQKTGNEISSKRRNLFSIQIHVDTQGSYLLSSVTVMNCLPILWNVLLVQNATAHLTGVNRNIRIDRTEIS